MMATYLNNQEVIRLENIQCSYAHVDIRHARLNILEGERVGLLGLNYSGKTALAGALAGFAPPDKGSIYYYEQKVSIQSQDQARSMGIFYVNQTLSLIDEFTVRENIMLFPRKYRKHSADFWAEDTKSVFSALDIEVELDEITGNLDDRTKILLEVAKAVLSEAKVIVFDNILHLFVAFHDSYFDMLFDKLKKLGISVLIAETSIDLLLEFCHRIFVMRKGITAGVFYAKDTNAEELTIAMLGGDYRKDEREHINQYQKSQRTENILLEAKGLQYQHILKDITFTVREKEMLGILNVNKVSGQIIQNIFTGEVQANAGRVLFHTNNSTQLESPFDTSDIAVLPEEDTMFDCFSIEENLEFSVVKDHSGPFWYVHKNRMKYDVDQLLDTFIKDEGELLIKGSDVPNNRLISKQLMICRALMTHPRLMLLMHPTLHMDDVKMSKISYSIQKIPRFDCAVIVISSDIEFLLDTCERMLVVNYGRVDADLPINNKTRTNAKQWGGNRD